ncbi:MAG: hypothetical protein R6T98_07050 [Desulfatiglandales bacterium]
MSTPVKYAPVPSSGATPVEHPEGYPVQRGEAGQACPPSLSLRRGGRTKLSGVMV